MAEALQLRGSLTGGRERENAERRIGQNALQGPLSSIRVPPSTVSEPQKRAFKFETQQWIEPVRKIVN